MIAAILQPQSPGAHRAPLNDKDHSHLVMDVIDRVPGLGSRASGLRQQLVDERLRHGAYRREFGDDPPDVSDWIGADPSRGVRG